MEWDDLRLFLAVARRESLSKAGRDLRLDPATLGRRMARLEQDLGQRLFAKSPQGYELLPEGARLLPHAERAEAAMIAAQNTWATEEGGLQGQIRIGAPDGCANYLLPQVIAEISVQNPALEVQIVALPRVFNLSKREADLAIGVSRPQAGRLTVQKLTDYRLHLAASKSYLAAHGPIVEPADLVTHRLVGYISDMIFDKELDYLAELGLGPVALGSNSVSVQLNLLRQGAGIGVVHDFARFAAPELQDILADEISFTRSFWLIRHADDVQVSRLNRFAVLLASGLKRTVSLLEGQR